MLAVGAKAGGGDFAESTGRRPLWITSVTVYFSVLRTV